MDENPHFTLAETYDKIAMQKTFLSEGKHHGSFVDNFSFAAHTACATFTFCVPHCDINGRIRLGAMCFTDHSEKRFF